MHAWRSSGTNRLRRGLLTFVLLAAGFAAGSTLSPHSVGGEENRRAPKRKAFLSGSERSVVVLNEILSVLKQMDARLERIERAATAKPKD